MMRGEREERRQGECKWRGEEDNRVKKRSGKKKRREGGVMDSREEG
jgi:hypothetical protein